VSEKQIAIVLVTHNSAEFIGACLSSIVPSGADIIVVDNGSTDGTAGIIRRFPSVRLIETCANLGYGKAINLGALQATHEYLILSNTDVVFREDTIATLVSFLKSHPGVGIVGPQQVSPGGGWQRSYGDTPGIWAGVKEAFGVNSVCRCYRRFRWPSRVDVHPKEVGYVFGAVLALPRSAFVQAKGFDEDFYFYGDESDLCIRLRKMGWKVVFCPFTEVVHYGGGDSTRVDHSDRFYRFLTTSEAMLARRHLPLWQARTYLWLKRVYFLELSLIFRLLKVLSPPSKITHLSQKIWVMDTYKRLWAEQLTTLKDCGTGRLGTY